MASEWLATAKRRIAQTPAWAELNKALFAAVQQQLAENSTLFFTDLADAEKILLMDRATMLVRSSAAYKELMGNVSETLDLCLNERAVQQLGSEAIAADSHSDASPAPSSSLSPAPASTSKAAASPHPHSSLAASGLAASGLADSNQRTQVLLREAAAGAAELMRRWPDQRKRLQCCLNQQLPAALRATAWSLCLHHPAATSKYVRQATAQRLDTVSKKDVLITQQAEAILAGAPTLQPLLQPSIRRQAVGAMKTVLSYRETLTGSLPPDADFYLLAPLLHVYVRELGAEASGTDTAFVGDLVGRFFRWLEQRPPAATDAAARQKLVESAVVLLRMHDSALHQHLATVLKADGGPAPALLRIFTPILERLFVGTLALDAVCFVWDQLIIGLTATHFQCLHFILVAVILLLRDNLMACEKTAAVAGVIEDHSAGITVRQLQRVLETKFLGEMKTMLAKSSEREAFPVVDAAATLGSLPPWEHWTKDKPVNRTSAAARAKERQKREVEEHRKAMERLKRDAEVRRKLEQDRLDAEHRKRVELAEKQKKAEEELQLERERIAVIEAKESKLREELNAERRRREELEARFGSDEAELRQERELLRKLESKQRLEARQAAAREEPVQEPTKPSAKDLARSRQVSQKNLALASTNKSVFSLQGASKASSRKGRRKEPEKALPPDQELLVDLLTAGRTPIDILVNGTGMAAERLEQQTAAIIEAYERDVEEAQDRVLGQSFSSTDFQTLSAEEKRATKERVLLEVLKIQQEQDDSLSWDSDSRASLSN